MEGYIRYLRSPFSEFLTIEAYNKRFSEMLDPNSSFEHQCRMAWEAGRRANNFDPSEYLTSEFPRLEALSSPDAILFQFDTFSKSVPMTEENLAELQAYVDGKLDAEVELEDATMRCEDLVRSKWDLMDVLSNLETGPFVVDNRV